MFKYLYTDIKTQKIFNKQKFISFKAISVFIVQVRNVEKT